MDTKEYNGYTNYATWAVNLWLSNDEDTSHLVRSIALHVVSDNPARDHKWRFADRLQDTVRIGMVLQQIKDHVSLTYDLVMSTLDGVDWLELSEMLLEGNGLLDEYKAAMTQEKEQWDAAKQT